MINKELFSKKSEYVFSNWRVTLSTDENVDHPDFVYSVLHKVFDKDNGYYPDLSVNIFYTDQSSEWERVYEDIKALATVFVPRGLFAFYEVINKANISHLPVEHHCNRYYRYKNLVLCEFPYQTDGFKMICDIEKKDIYISGPPTCLSRILDDCISVLSKNLPIHGCAVAENGKATCFLGDSGSGKTFLLLLMMKVGSSYVADDELFILDGKIFSVAELVHIRSGLIESFSFDDAENKSNKKRLVSANSLASEICKEAVVKCYYVVSSKSEPSYLQWFPSIARQSYWWLVFFEDSDIDLSEMANKVSRSKNIVQKILDKEEIRVPDFKKIKEYYESDCSLKTDDILKDVFQ